MVRPMRPGSLRLAFGALILLVVAAWTITGIAPPPARDAAAPLTEFSAARAFAHVQAIAKRPHPVGSAAHDEVRDYILGTLGAMGLAAGVQTTSSAAKVAGVVYGARVQNVLARVPGTRPGPAVLLAAHYDTVPQALGASDDASGVATLLETARALLAGPRLENDVLLLFSDGEEIAASGALAFTNEELETNPVGVALNFEARGTRGAVALYDTSTRDDGLIAALADAAPRIVSTSLLGSLARLLPNDSDATVFKRAGIPTYAFAYVDHLYEYHHYTDSPEALDLRSLQHDGDYALPLARHLGHATLPLPAEEEVVYFDVLGHGLVRYSPLVARALALLTLGLLAALFPFARRARPGAHLTPGGLALGASLAVGAVLLSVLAAGLVHGLLALALDPFVLFARPLLATAAGLAAGGAAFSLVYARALQRGDATRLVLGALVAWALPLALTAALVPAASFVFQWPLLAALAGTALWLRSGEEGGARVDLALAMSLVPATFFWSYVAYSLYVMLGPNAPELSVAAATAPLVLALPVAARTGAVGLRQLAGAAALTALAVVTVDGALVRASPELLRPDELVYTLEGHGKTGVWSTNTPHHDPFVAQRVPEGKTSRDEPGAPLPPTQIESSTVTEGGLQHATLVLRSPRNARCFRFWEVTKQPIVKALVNGQLVADVVRFSPELDEKLMRLYSGGRRQAVWVAEYCGSGGEPLKLDLFSEAGKPVRLRIMEVADGLPGAPLGPRTSSDGYPAADSDQTDIMTDVKL